MVQSCTCLTIVILCLIVILLIYPQVIDYCTEHTKSDNYINMSLDTLSSPRYYTGAGKNISHNQDVINHRGYSQDTKYISDVLAGNDGYIPIIREDNIGNEYTGAPHDISSSSDREGFWYDTNKLDDSEWHPKSMDKEFQDILNNENNKRDILIEYKKKDRMYNMSAENNNISTEGFGTNRAPVYWNEKDYPIVTSNGFNMDAVFQQGNTDKQRVVHVSTTNFDLRGLDTHIVDAMYNEADIISRTTESHAVKV